MNTATLMKCDPDLCLHGYRIKRNESSASLSSFVHYDFLHQKLRGLEDENRKLRTEVGYS